MTKVAVFPQLTLADFPGIGLLPCPFCGSVSLELANTHTPAYWIECQDCSAQLTADIHSYKNEREHRSPKLHRESARDAIRKWNRRFPLDEIQRIAVRAQDQRDLGGKSR